MSRPIVLSNGELHIGINRYGLVHDFYFPYVGLENHASGNSPRHRVGVWIDGNLSWLDDDSWKLEMSYPHDSLIGHVIATHDGLGVRLEFDDCVDSEVSALMRNIHIVNLSDQAREIRLFLHQAFIIGDSRSNTDTAQYLPDQHAILLYRGRRAFVVSARSDDDFFDQHSIGLFGIEGHDGTYRDAEDGELSGNNVEHGRVDSTLRFKFDIEAHGSKRVHYWVACGTSIREALYVHKQVLAKGVDERQNSTASWWHNWLEPAISLSEKLDPKYRQSFIDSFMIVKAHCDKRGAVIASSDTMSLTHARDAYAYCWPRDAVYALWPLMRAGYTDELLQFFEFCRRGLNSSGYLAHKYRADGAIGSSWHPYLHDDGTVAPPIQEDETAAVLFLIAQFYDIHQDQRFLNNFYSAMVVPMADFLAGYVDHNTGLPKPSYDLWEEKFLTTTYTTALVNASLLAAAELAEVKKDSARAVAWRSAATDIQNAAAKHFYDDELGMFIKGMQIHKDGTLVPDKTVDLSSFYGVFMFGLFDQESHEFKSSLATIERMFDLDNQGLVPRYPNDFYCRPEGTDVSNNWLICSLWMAQYYHESGKDERVTRVLDFIKKMSDERPTLPEQVDAAEAKSRDIAPLVWTHAEYLSTQLDLIHDANVNP